MQAIDDAMEEIQAMRHWDAFTAAFRERAYTDIRKRLELMAKAVRREALRDAADRLGARHSIYDFLASQVQGALRDMAKEPT